MQSVEELKNGDAGVGDDQLPGLVLCVVQWCVVHRRQRGL